MYTKIHPVDKIPVTDWSKPDQLVHCENGMVVLTTGEHSNDVFSGVLLSENNNTHRYATNWNKSTFFLCPRAITVTFSNEPI